MKHFIYGFVLIIVLAAACSGCQTVSLEYEHISHPLAGPPFGPQSEEDWLDHIQLCGSRDYYLSERLNAYSALCTGYVLTDGGFYGPHLTGSMRVGIKLSL